MHCIVYAQFEWHGANAGQAHLKPSTERKLIGLVKDVIIVKTSNYQKLMCIQETVEV